MSSYLFVALLFVALLMIELIYLRLARRFDIGASVSERSSATHTEFTPTGGGIVFLLAAIAYALFRQGDIVPHFKSVLTGGIVLGVVSFIDDVHELPPSFRLVVQTIVVAATYLWLTPEPGFYVAALLLGVGFINAYNFMDGISGILTIYSLVTLATIWYALSHCGPEVYWVATDLEPFIAALLVATVVFGIFNFRRDSLIFCGDVGSIVMGFFIMFLMVTLVAITHEAYWIAFLLVYGVDTILTIFDRLSRGENILRPHRKHLYQALANSRGMAHLKISCIYGGLQMVINVGLLMMPEPMRWPYVIIVACALTAGYYITRALVLKKDLQK